MKVKNLLGNYDSNNEKDEVHELPSASYHQENKSIAKRGSLQLFESNLDFNNNHRHHEPH